MQDRHEIFATMDRALTPNSFLQIQTFGPWSTKKGEDMEEFCHCSGGEYSKESVYRGTQHFAQAFGDVG
jgi:hypothetical protein